MIRRRRWIIRYEVSRITRSARLRGQPCHDLRRVQIFARPVAAPLDLELALGKALRADQNLPGNTDQVGGGELGAGALVGVVVQYFDAPGGELAIKLFARSIGVGRALLQ